MTYLVIVDATPDKKIAKMQEYSTKDGADAHVARVVLNYPDAFVVDKPAQYERHHTTVDVTAKTITYNSSAHDAKKIKDNAQNEIRKLEGTVTPRRIREMTTVAGAKWVDDVEKLIAIERSKL